MAEVYVYRANRVRKLREGVSFEAYKAKYPEAVKITAPPSPKTMERWMDEGVAKALDGCRVEPDGRCPHGMPSWIMEVGMV